MSRLIVVVFILAALLQGCASAPMASAEKDTAAKSFDVPSNKSNLYVYRNENFGAALSMDVYINNQLIGQTAAKTYFKLELDPGKYQVKSKAENESILDVILRAGENFYIWQEVKMGIITGRTKLSNVDVNTGKSGVLESKLIASSVSESDLRPLDRVFVNSADEAGKLRELKILLDQGLITHQEYEAAKTKILEGL